MRQVPVIAGRLCLAGAALAAAAIAAGPLAAATPREAVQAVLQTSVASWNDGKLDLFMASYENAPTTLFVGGGTVLTGIAAIRAHYLARYGGRAASMGRLRIDTLDYRQIDASYALLIGRYHVVRAGAPGPEATGLTSLLFHLTPLGWRIASDHSD